MDDPSNSGQNGSETRQMGANQSEIIHNTAGPSLGPSPSPAIPSILSYAQLASMYSDIARASTILDSTCGQAPTQTDRGIALVASRHAQALFGHIQATAQATPPPPPPQPAPPSANSWKGKGRAVHLETLNEETDTERLKVENEMLRKQLAVMSRRSGEMQTSVAVDERERRASQNTIRALHADKRYLFTRLQTAEAQVARAEYELHYLRSFLLNRVRPKSDRRSRKRQRQAEPELLPPLPQEIPEEEALPVPLAPAESVIPAGKQSKGPSENSDAPTLQLDSQGDVIMDIDPPEPAQPAEESTVEVSGSRVELTDPQPPESSSRRRVTMGDAETEHLLLAAARLTRVSKRYIPPPPAEPRFLPYSMAFPAYYPYPVNGAGNHYPYASPEFQIQVPSSPEPVEESPERPTRVLRSARAAVAKAANSDREEEIRPVASTSTGTPGQPKKIGRPRGSLNKTKLIPLNETAASQRRLRALENAMAGRPRNSKLEIQEPARPDVGVALAAKLAQPTTGQASNAINAEQGDSGLESQESGLDLLLAAQDIREPGAGPAAVADRERSQSRAVAAPTVAEQAKRAGTQEYVEDDEDDYYYEDDVDEDQQQQEQQQPSASTSQAATNGAPSAAGGLDRNLSALDVLAEQAFGQNLNPANAQASLSILAGANGSSLPPGLSFPPMPFPTNMYGQPQLTIPEQLARGVDATHHLIDPTDLKKGMTPAAALAKKARSPYLKWTAEEDEKLVLGVAEHGTRWDEVALQLPTRSYHQCRQRWLRGLKSGNALPPHMKHLKGKIDVAVAAHEAAKANRRVNTTTPNNRWSDNEE